MGLEVKLKSMPLFVGLTQGMLCLQQVVVTSLTSWPITLQLEHREFLSNDAVINAQKSRCHIKCALKHRSCYLYQSVCLDYF